MRGRQRRRRSIEEATAHGPATPLLIPITCSPNLRAQAQDPTSLFSGSTSDEVYQSTRYGLELRRPLVLPATTNVDGVSWVGLQRQRNRPFLKTIVINQQPCRHAGETLRIDYLTLILKRLTDPLRMLPKDDAVQKVVEFMDLYSISQEDFDTIVELSKLKGKPSPLEGVQPAVKAALTKAYNKGSSSRLVRAADLITLPGIKKAPKKRIAAILEPVDDELARENGDALAETEEENSSDTDDMDTGNGEKKLPTDLQNLNSKGIKVELDLKGAGSSSAKKTPAGRGRGRGRGGGVGSASTSTEKKGGRGSGAAAAAKRKR